MGDEGSQDGQETRVLEQLVLLPSRLTFAALCAMT